MQDEGYIKFTPHWTKVPAYPQEAVAGLLQYRQAAYRHGWIGCYPNGIGYGNISVRQSVGEAPFYITGSATGGYAQLQPKHIALVTRTAPATNELWCAGPLLASSESMSHAIIYDILPEVNAVLHIHHLPAWERLLYQVPTTNADAPYGSPAMVASIATLLHTTDLPERKIFAMAGHREGLFTFGSGLDEALEVAEEWLVV